MVELANMLDYKISGGQVLDGAGAEPVPADVGIVGERIEAVGDLSGAPASALINAPGCYVAPGFIDVHSHSDAYLLIEPSAPSKLYQGVTTEIVGNCGASAAPLVDVSFLPADWRDQVYPGPWRTVADYRVLLERARPAPNVMLLVGHGKLRSWVMGDQDRPATADECRAMVRLLEQSLDDGARGLSSGLIYPPGRFAAPEELSDLAAATARHGGIYTTHMRSEGSRLLEAIEETLALARGTGVRTQISHLKTSGHRNWSKLPAALELIRRARAAGIDVAADRYPYTASSTDLDVILPAWALVGGQAAVLRRLRDPAERERLRQVLAGARAENDWATIVVGSTGDVSWRGRPLLEVAQALDVEPGEAALRLMERDELKTSAFFFGMSAENLSKILAEPYVMLGSDASLRALAGPLSLDFPHPRAYGAFARFLRAALDGKTVALPEAVRKMTSLPADHFRLAQRGRVAPGNYADLVVFNPATVRERATFAKPHALAEGIEHVMVNGVLTLSPRGLTGHRSGRIL
ncbi:MAG: D-aminoacylase [Lentisphaerae bacterium]|nr:D-aminoacylase [Lentisphaerota bacterium]